MSKLDLVGIAPNYSPGAYCNFETGEQLSNPPVPMLASHRFFETDDHQLGHEIDGKLRCVVPPEGMNDYAALWPDCAALVAQLTN